MKKQRAKLQQNKEQARIKLKIFKFKYKNITNNTKLLNKIEGKNGFFRYNRKQEWVLSVKPKARMGSFGQTEGENGF